MTNCAQCHTAPVKRPEHKYCGRLCFFAALRKPRPLCAACGTPCRSRDQRYCSNRCGHAHRKTLKPKCQAGCGARVRLRSAKFCSKRCAWMANRGWEIGAKGRERARAVNRAKFLARLKARLGEKATASQLWKAGYLAGYRACYASWTRKVQRGELAWVRERRIRNWDAA